MTMPLSESPEAALLRQELSAAVGDRYEIGEILGGGRAGLVFRARSKELAREVALKTAWHDALSRAQMLRELTLTSEIKHASVLEMRQIDAPTGMIVVEMPLLTGYTAHDFLEGNKPVAFEKVVEFIRGPADALDAAHAQGIVHAGLCPVKILLDHSGRPFITDFGLRLPAHPGQWYDEPPDSIGAPAYTPLEQRHNDPNLSGRVDQYALAIIAFELVRGHRTWHVNEDRVVEVEPLEILQGRPIAEGVPLTVNMALRRATSRDAGYRYESVAAFAEAFAGKVPTVVAAEHIYRDQIIEKRRPPYALIAVIVVLAVLAGVSRQSVRDDVRNWWKGRSLAATPSVFPNDPGGGGSGGGAVSSTTTPAPPSREESPRRAPSGEPNNTRVGEKSDRRPSGGTPGTTVDIFPKSGNPQQGEPAGPGKGSSGTQSASPRPGAVPPKNSISDAERNAAAARDSAAAVTGVFTVSIVGANTAGVVVDGQYQGQAPFTWRGPLGRHVVTLRGIQTYSPRSATVRVSATDTARVTFTISRP